MEHPTQQMSESLDEKWIIVSPEEDSFSKAVLESTPVLALSEFAPFFWGIGLALPAYGEKLYMKAAGIVIAFTLAPIACFLLLTCLLRFCSSKQKRRPWKNATSKARWITLYLVVIAVGLDWWING